MAKRRRLIFAILGLVVLGIGLISALVLSGRITLFKPKAAGVCSGTINCTDSNGIVTTINCDSPNITDSTSCLAQTTGLTCPSNCAWNPVADCGTGNSCEQGTSCQSDETPTGNTCILTNNAPGICCHINPTCNAPNTCNVTAPGCPNNMSEISTCSSGGQQGICCAPASCQPDFCIGGNSSLCESPMVPVLDFNCSQTNQRCTCPGGGGGGGGGGTDTCSGTCYGPIVNGVTLNNCGTIGYVNAPGTCSTAGTYCCFPPGTGTLTDQAQGAFAYCEDGNGPVYPLPGLPIHMTGQDQTDSGSTNYGNVTTDATGKAMHGSLSTSPTQWFDLYIDIPPTWIINTHPFAGTAQANLTVPGTGQLYSNLTRGDTHTSVFENCMNGGGVWTPAGNNNLPGVTWFCGGNPNPLNPLTWAGQPYPLSYYFGLVGKGNYNALLHFSNCTLPTPSPTPGTAPQCTNIKAYDTSWNQLTITQLDALAPSANVYFSVSGTTSSTFDAARFTINGVVEPTTTLIKPGTTQEFYMQYTIPNNGTSAFIVTGQLHDPTTNQWY